MPLPHTHVTLANGLDVLVHEDHDCPIVAVNIWYHVGSKNEKPGRTGFAHLFEHLMFEGSEHHDKGYFEPLQEAGGTLNGSTNADRTNYWEVVPTNALELALWMESDRMGYLLPALTEKKFQNQRDVVLNERRQNYENRPYGFAGMAMMAALCTRRMHPYHWLTIGEAGRSARSGARGRPGLLPELLPPAQRVSGARRRRSHGRCAAARRALLRIDRRGRSAPSGGALRDPNRPRARCGCCSRIGSSCPACTWPGTPRVSSPPVTPRWIWSPSSWRAARRRDSIGRSSTISGSPPRLPRRRTRVRSAGSSRWSRPPRQGARFRTSRPRSPTRSMPSSRPGRRPPKWSAASRRRSHTSSIVCRRWADSAASRIS